MNVGYAARCTQPQSQSNNLLRLDVDKVDVGTSALHEEVEQAPKTSLLHLGSRTLNLKSKKALSRVSCRSST